MKGQILRDLSRVMMKFWEPEVGTTFVGRFEAVGETGKCAKVVGADGKEVFITTGSIQTPIADGTQVVVTYKGAKELQSGLKLRIWDVRAL